MKTDALSTTSHGISIDKSNLHASAPIEFSGATGETGVTDVSGFGGSSKGRRDCFVRRDCLSDCEELKFILLNFILLNDPKPVCPSTTRLAF